jgi:hypothetical protein
MDALLSKFQGKIDSKKIVATVNEIDALYIADGFTKEDIPPIVAKLMMMASGLKGLTGPERKKLVIGLLNHLIEKIERATKTASSKRFSSPWFPPWSTASRGC